MSLEPDLLIDRRRLSRGRAFWRTVAVLAIAIGVLAVLRPAGLPHMPAASGGGYVARLPVSGIITDDPKVTRALHDLADDTDAAALMVVIDSPGGSVSGGEALHDAILRVAANKPVVAVMGGTAASAGYMIAVPAARIFARQSTITGSIGVILETGDAAGLLKTLGITVDPIVSGPLKDQPNYARPLTPQGREVLQGLVMDMYDQFVGMVAAGRHMEAARVRELADGRAYTGRQALSLGLVDEIGGEAEARAWLASARGVPADLPAQDLETTPLLRRMFGDWTGSLWKVVMSQGVNLDGALAIWQPSGK